MITPIEANGFSFSTPPSSWLLSKVGVVAAIAFNAYHLSVDRFSPEGMAIIASLEICSLMSLGIFASHQHKRGSTFSDHLICLEAACFFYCLRGIAALFGIYTAFQNQEASSFDRKRLALAAASLALLGISSISLTNLLNKANP